MKLQENTMIAASTNFQSSVNIAFDFDNAKKIKGFIPTAEAIKFIEEAVLSTKNAARGENAAFDKNARNSASAKRAGILIGPYGKGKSYIVLETLSLLYNNPELREVFEGLAAKIKEKNPQVAQNILEYIKSKKRLLPIVINGNSQSLAQSFLYALNLTLKKREFKNLMPETHFESAVKMIEKWETEYPETFEKFKSHASVRPEEFKRQLLNYNADFFEEFEKLYPSLTSGSEFNPFSGFDVVEVYEKTCKKLCETGLYDGIFVVYDEFGKYLESSIAHATVKDTKLLQDFAELCDRSGKEQLHLLLICHKEIENYIDILPKQKVDGWKGVSERFSHIHLYNNYSEVYSLIRAAIIKKSDEWEKFCAQNKSQFENLKNVWFKGSFRLFANLEENFEDTILYGAYPLHPVTTYILPRLSEKVAQNERTLFTFLSGNDKNGFSSLIEKTCAGGEKFLQNSKIIFFTPDILFDYFENLLFAENYTSEIKKYYLVASAILRQTEKSSLEAKIVKTIALIYCLNQFERLSPDLNFLFALYDDAGFSREEIRAAVKNLAEKGFVYLNVHNNYLQLKANSGIDVPALISDCVEKRRRTVSIVDILNNFNTQKFIYPVSYNVKNRMTRYFRFVFISEKEFLQNEDWANLSKKINCDGCVFAIFKDFENGEKLGSSDFETDAVIEKAKKVSSINKNLVFIISKFEENFTEKLRRFDSAAFLRNQILSSLENSTDSVLFDEYDLIYQDLHEVIKQIVHSYIQPERNLALYVSLGEKQRLYRKSDFTNLVSKICSEIFYRTPVVNNEMLNKNCLTGAATKSREKLIDAMLNSPFMDLGLSGSGQEVSFMRSTLLLPGILKKCEKDSAASQKKIFNLEPQTENTKNDENFKNLFEGIKQFFEHSQEKEISFIELFDLLENEKNGISLRRGLIPVYIAAVVSSFAKNVVFKKNGIEVPVNAKSLAEIAENPADFLVRVQKWNDEKENYVEKLENIFCEFVISEEKNVNGYFYLLNAMLRWYRSLPKYTKQMKKSDADTEYFSFLNILKQGVGGTNEILFEKIPSVFKSEKTEKGDSAILEKVKKAKNFFDTALENLAEKIIDKTKKTFDKNTGEKSLKNVLLEFCTKLAPEIENQIFENGAHSLLKVYKNAGNDEMQIAAEMAKVLAGLSLDDWNDETVNVFFARLDEFNRTLLEFKGSSPENAEKVESENAGESAENYEIRFAKNGTENARTKSFKKVKCSVRAKSLEEEIWRTFEEMGQSVTEAEKRQVLVSLLERFC